MDKLKPCPFCGGAPVVKAGKTTLVQCKNCGCTAFQILHDRDSAVRTWQMRNEASAQIELLNDKSDAPQPDSRGYVMTAVKNLIEVKGRFHTEQAFARLVSAYNAAIAQSAGKV